MFGLGAGIVINPIRPGYRGDRSSLGQIQSATGWLWLAGQWKKINVAMVCRDIWGNAVAIVAIFLMGQLRDF